MRGGHIERQHQLAVKMHERFQPFAEARRKAARSLPARFRNAIADTG